jgi:hypothetical protein
MTVLELMQHLGECDPTMEVCILADDEEYYAIDGVSEIEGDYYIGADGGEVDETFVALELMQDEEVDESLN